MIQVMMKPCMLFFSLYIIIQILCYASDFVVLTKCSYNTKVTSANGASHKLSSLYLVQVFQFGRQVVSDHFHGFERRLVEVRRLPIHHLYDHDTQRPDIHLDRKTVNKLKR